MGTTYNSDIIHAVREIKGTEDIYLVNKLMKNSWIMLVAYIPDFQKGVIKFSLGKISKHVDMSHRIV